MNFYQKFYTNQIHSSSLLCQLATMWKSQVLCDAIIRSGNVITKAHRVVLVAACPMLQSMENAAVGSHLEVRLASDIKKDSIHTFLQYLYEGFMMLTEENCKDVEKIARLLQVDSVIKCCADFYKCLSTKTGNTDLNDPYKYTFHDMVEFRHVRSSDLQKLHQDRMTKRGTDFPRPSSPGGKRQRLNRPGSPPSETVTIDDTVSMSNSYNSSIPDPWERVPRLGTPPMARQNVASKPGVIEVVEDSLELIQTEPPNASGNRPNDRRSSQKSVSIAVSSQIKSNTDLQIVNVSDSSTRSRPPDPSTSVNTSQSSITVSPLTLLSEMSTPVLSTAPSILPTVSSPRTSEVFHISMPQQPTPHVSRPPVTSLPFAVGSASQSGTQHQPLTVQRSQSQSQGSSSKNESFERVTPSDTYEKGAEKIPARPNISNDKAPDISIVKIESDDENTGLDMYVDMPDESEAKLQKRLEQQDDGSDTEHDTLDWPREHMSGEDNGHMNSEQNAWFMGQQQYKGYPEFGVLEHSQAIGMGSKSSQASNPVVKDKSSGNSISSHKNVSGLDLSISEYKARHSSVDNTTPKSRDLWGDPLQYQCQFCSEQFDNKQTLHTHHHENHKCNFLFVCDSCGKGFNSRLGYDNHIKLNHGSVEDCFTCDVCLKRFPTQNTLTIHQRVHSEYRPFICTECGRSYKHKKDLKHHRCAL